MGQDGARLSKLKEVFKKAIQEILKEEENVKTLAMSPVVRDSFYSESTVQFSPDEISKLFVDLKARLVEVFKIKVRQTNLDFKLNNLDREIKEGRISMKDIKNEEYINEIFESYIADKKEEYVKALEKEIECSDKAILDLNNEKAELEAILKFLEFENEEHEREYNKLIADVEGIF